MFEDHRAVDVPPVPRMEDWRRPRSRRPADPVAACDDLRVGYALTLIADAQRNVRSLDVEVFDGRRAEAVEDIAIALLEARRALSRAARLPEDSAEGRDELEDALHHARCAVDAFERLLP